MDNVRGSHIYGQLAKPRKEGKLPALLIVQWAGVYGLDKSWVTNRAEQGWLALNIMPHDLPFDQPKAFYEEAAKTTHKDYVAIGDGDREQVYFLRMYLACYRAAEYLAERPDWDGRTLVVMGTSQGGQQSIVTAGLHPKVTAMLANVPGGCDVAAPRAGRAAGFPYFADRARWKKDDRIVDTGRYFDAANFAARVKVPALVSLGLIDEACPPAGILAACNGMKGPKEVLILPASDHHGKGNAQAPYFIRAEEWLAKLANGESPVGAE
jgi:cephalosporin-C deacetylase-like acetyl esterase